MSLLTLARKPPTTVMLRADGRVELAPFYLRSSVTHVEGTLVLGFIPPTTVVLQNARENCITPPRDLGNF